MLTPVLWVLIFEVINQVVSVPNQFLVFVFMNNHKKIAIYTTATTRISPRLWDDGQLLFGPKPAAEQDPSSTESGDLKAPGEIASSLEAVQSEALEQFNAAQPTENHFFTLPVALKAIEWDLRSALVDFDEVLPLAESVAEFRDEVTLFQQGGGRNVEESSEIAGGMYGTAASDSHVESSGELPSDPKTPDDSLVARAKRRLENKEQSRSSSGVIVFEEQLAAAAPLSGRCTITALSQLVLELPASGHGHELDSAHRVGVGTKGSSHMVAASVADSAPVSSTTPKFGQLFTRLRQKRSQAAESR